MKCKKMKTCNTCGAPFKTTRGCLLEKRCPACRKLNARNGRDNEYTLSSGITHIPENIENRIAAIIKVQDELYTTRNNNDYEDPIIIAEETGLSVENVKKALRYRELNNSITLKDLDNIEKYTYDNKYSTHPEYIVDNDDLREQIDIILGYLTKKEQTVIKLRLGLVDDLSDRTLDEICAIIKTNREKVRNIEAAAIKKMKHPNIGRPLLDYLVH